MEENSTGSLISWLIRCLFCSKPWILFALPFDWHPQFLSTYCWLVSRHPCWSLLLLGSGSGKQQFISSVPCKHIKSPSARQSGLLATSFFSGFATLGVHGWPDRAPLSQQYPGILNFDTFWWRNLAILLFFNDSVSKIATSSFGFRCLRIRTVWYCSYNKGLLQPPFYLFWIIIFQNLPGNYLWVWNLLPRQEHLPSLLNLQAAQRLKPHQQATSEHWQQKQ